MGDKDSIKKQNIEYILKGNTFFVANGRYRLDSFVPSLASALSSAMSKS